MPQVAVPVAQSALSVEEEFLMTFQVVLVGSDGLIIGSDRRILYRSQPDGHIDAGMIQPLAGSKFNKSPTGEVICASAGTPVSADVALAIAINCDPKAYTDDASWKSVVNQVAKETAEYSQQLEEVIVVRRDVPTQAIVVSIQPSVYSTVISDFICTGISTPARFLPRHLWKRSPLNNLKTLALLTLAFAEREQPSGIGGGFDLMILEASGKVSWENYEPDDSRLKKLREDFVQTMAGTIFPQ
jgi:hypothetical protein